MSFASPFGYWGLHPLWWAGMTLIVIVAGVFGYWAVHYSSLRLSNDEK